LEAMEVYWSCSQHGPEARDAKPGFGCFADRSETSVEGFQE
jgi:hypothetical protein